MIQNENEITRIQKTFEWNLSKRIQHNSSTFDWIIIEDICHLKSKKKRYVKLESENEIIKVIVLVSFCKKRPNSELKREI